MRLGLLLLFVVCAVPAFAQSVRTESTVRRSMYRPANAAAERAGVADWPTFEDDSDGTQVHITGDYRNADVTILTARGYGQARALALGRRLAATMGRPTADFILYDGVRLGGVDLELNRTVTREGNVSRVAFPLGRLAGALEASDLPRPIGVALLFDVPGEVTLAGRTYREPTAWSLRDLPRGDYVRTVERHWWGLATVVGFGALFLIGFPILMWRLIRMVRRVAKASDETSEGTPNEAGVTDGPPPTLAESQARYEASRKGRAGLWLRVLPFLPLAIFPLFSALKPHMSDGANWLPEGSEAVLRYGPLAVLLPGLLIFAFARRSFGRMRRETPRDASTMMLPWMMAGMVAVTAIFFVVTTFPAALRPVPATLRRVLIFGVPLSLFAIGFVRTRLATRADRRDLPDDDPDAIAAREFAKAAGVTLRGVRRIPGEAPNAAATLWRTVLITDGARERLTPQERRAVIAHEIGHLRHGHVPALFLGSLSLLVLYVTLRRSGDGWMRGHLPEGVLGLLDSGLVGIFILPLVVSVVLGPARRRNEHSADRFALRMVGDYGTVARSLARVHLLGGAPHTLRGFDALAASHPSLAQRLDALRAAARELGLPVDDATVRPLFGPQ